MDELERATDFIRRAGERLGHSSEVIQETVRAWEILHAHSDWIDDRVRTRLLNFLANADVWREWKGRGGDAGAFCDLF